MKIVSFFLLLILLISGWVNPIQPMVAVSDNLCPKNMVLISGGTFRIGDDRSNFLEEKAAENVTVDNFCIDRYEVTNANFAEFVKSTDYITVAERPLSKKQFPDLPDEQRSPGSLVFQPPEEVTQVPYLSWWHWVVGANWRHPYGPDSSIEGKNNYPVVHIAYEDAVAYAQWVGKSLPTEAQWEYAARGGLKNKIFSWGMNILLKKRILGKEFSLFLILRKMVILGHPQ